jgi:hypothetical protein
MVTIYAILIVEQLFLILVYAAKMNNYSTLKISPVKIIQVFNKFIEYLNDFYIFAMSF